SDRYPRHVQFPPPMTEARRTRGGMMIVVPALAVAEKANDQIVATAFIGVVVAIAPRMRHRIDGPGDVPNEDRTNEHSPDQYAEAELNCVQRASPYNQFNEERAGKEAQP